MIGHSLRFRLAALTTISVSSVFCLFSAFLYFRIHADMMRDLDIMIESKARVLAESFQSHTGEWREVEHLLAQSGGSTALFVWRGGENRVFQNSIWPADLDPREVSSKLVLSENWRDLRAPDDAKIMPSDDSTIQPQAASRSSSPGPQAMLTRLPSNVSPPGDPLRRYGAFSSGRIKIVMGTDQKFFMDRLAEFRRLLLTALAPAILLSFLLGIIIARRSLASLNALVEAIEKITARGLDLRIPPERSDREFRKLISVVNEMLERLQRSFAESRRFTDAAAHELRSPLTILQGKLDEAMRSETPGSDRQQSFAELMEEVARLKGITDRLLLLARSDAGRLDLYKQSVNLDALVKNLVEDARLLAPDLEFSSKLDPCTIQCDSALIMQVIHNLLSNAMKYNSAEHGFVRLELVNGSKEIELRISNSGPPIPPELGERIFDRFFRGDESHSRRIEGTGLGLSLAREIAHAHGGKLVLCRSDPRETIFVLTLPMS